MSETPQKRYIFELQYNGSRYFGWQIQPKQISVQQVIQDCLHKIFQDFDIQVVGCGRTDTGVHAHQYFLHVDLPASHYEEQDLLFKLNRMLPDDIAIRNIRQSRPDFHARFDAVRRTYRYYVHRKKNPFKQQLSLYHPQSLDVLKMNQAAQFLVGNQDFTSFSKLHTDVKTNICTVFEAQWKEEEGNIYFEISANRFLRNMVRAVVGTLLEVGIGKIQVQEFEQIIRAKDRSKAGKSAAAHGLYLWNIEYEQ
ncbi:MAG: tRNA pseudouridine(38-40) synthase TruA [Bacteroidetes bacterium]|nr:MAG: tRNA pseudouridine(38-40) synthase TruA [Bacteroidota bacterium]